MARSIPGRKFYKLAPFLGSPQNLDFASFTQDQPQPWPKPGD
jgi:hypothetical protein